MADEIVVIEVSDGIACAQYIPDGVRVIIRDLDVPEEDRAECVQDVTGPQRNDDTAAWLATYHAVD